MYVKYIKNLAYSIYNSQNRVCLVVSSDTGEQWRTLYIFKHRQPMRTLGLPLTHTLLGHSSGSRVTWKSGPEFRGSGGEEVVRRRTWYLANFCSWKIPKLCKKSNHLLKRSFEKLETNIQLQKTSWLNYDTTIQWNIIQLLKMFNTERCSWNSSRWKI